MRRIIFFYIDADLVAKFDAWVKSLPKNDFLKITLFSTNEVPTIFNSLRTVLAETSTGDTDPIDTFLKDAEENWHNEIELKQIRTVNFNEDK